MTQRTVSVDGQILTTVGHVDSVGGEGHWAELAYSPGTPEFTIIQVNLFGDWRISAQDLTTILDIVVAAAHGKPIPHA